MGGSSVFGPWESLATYRGKIIASSQGKCFSSAYQFSSWKWTCGYEAVSRQTIHFRAPFHVRVWGFSSTGHVHDMIAQFKFIIGHSWNSQFQLWGFHISAHSSSLEHFWNPFRMSKHTTFYLELSSGSLQSSNEIQQSTSIFPLNFSSTCFLSYGWFYQCTISYLLVPSVEFSVPFVTFISTFPRTFKTSQHPLLHKISDTSNFTCPLSQQFFRGTFLSICYWQSGGWSLFEVSKLSLEHFRTPFRMQVFQTSWTSSGRLQSTKKVQHKDLCPVLPHFTCPLWIWYLGGIFQCIWYSSFFHAPPYSFDTSLQPPI